MPNFCSIQVLLSLVIVAELLSVVLVLGGHDGEALPWDELGIISLFVQWVALSSAALLCISRTWLGRMQSSWAGVVSYIIVLLVTLGLSELVFWIMRGSGMEYSASWHADLILRNMVISAIVSAVTLRMFYLQHQQRIQLEANANARIEALQARIRPHFLFNSMNTIAALIRQHPDHAEEAVEDLADLFRASLGNAQQQVTLASELENARRYLHIEKLRLGDRLQVSWDVETLPDDARLPPLILQPLLENAIYHGVEQLIEGGVIAIHGSMEGDKVCISIRNPVPGTAVPAGHAGHHMALDNIRERMQITFGQHGQVELEKNGDSCEVRVKFPLRATEVT